MNKGLCLVIAMFVAITYTVSAATLIESRANQHTMKMWIEGPKSRMEMPEQDGYMLTDVKQRKLYVISVNERTVMDMSSSFNSQTEKSKSDDIDIKLVKKGAGPSIAGYKTEHYTLSANGRHCADQYVSLEVLKAPDLKEYAQHAIGMSNTSPVSAVLDACTLASISVSERFNEIGFPLRTVEANGDRYEVTRIQPDTSPGPHAFEVPKDFQVVDIGQIRSQALSGGLGQYLKQHENNPQARGEGTDPEAQKDDSSTMDAIGDAVGEGLKGLKGLFGN